MLSNALLLHSYFTQRIFFVPNLSWRLHGGSVGDWSNGKSFDVNRVRFIERFVAWCGIAIDCSVYA